MYETTAIKLEKCFTFHLEDSQSTKDVDKFFVNTHHAIQQEIRNIERFELRMAIIAPMKSGKSTIINALIGDNILPARGNPMTTLPTEVVFKNDIEHPVLVLTEDAIELIIDLQYRMQHSLTNEDVVKLLHNQSHLVKMANDLIEKREDAFIRPSRFTTDLSEIQETLIFINDLIRIFINLSKEHADAFKNVNLKSFLQQNIRLEVPVSSLSDDYLTDIQTSIGSLTIVDTPGPNEAAASDELKEIVESELKKAGIVIIVLNFTSMGTQADHHIFQDIESIRKMSVNSDCIYVIVNKVDQRRRGDMSKDAVRKYIATKYDISEKPEKLSDRRIFEMKAVHCLAFRRFMRQFADLKKTKPDLSIKDMDTAEDLMDELYKSQCGDEEPSGKTLEEVVSDAQKMWKYGGLKEFVEGPIGDLFKKLAPASIESALNVCNRTGLELRNKIVVRLKMLSTSKEELESTCKNLRENCSEIVRLGKANRETLDQTIAGIQEKIVEIMQEVAESHQQMSETIKGNREKNLSSETTKYYAIKAVGSGLIVGGLVAAVIASGGLLGIAAASVGTTAGATFLGNADKEIKFENAAAAKKFLDDLENEIHQSSKKIYETVTIKIENMSRSANQALVRRLKEQTAKVVNDANTLLKTNFSIEPVDLANLEVNITLKGIDTKLAVKRYRPLWGYALFGRKEKLKSEASASDVSDIKLQMSREEIINICQKSCEDYMTEFRELVNQHINNVLVQTLQSYFNKLTSHFQVYQQSLVDTLRQSTAGKEKKERYIRDLNEILATTAENFKQVEIIANRLEINLNRA